MYIYYICKYVCVYFVFYLFKNDSHKIHMNRIKVCRQKAAICTNF